MDINDYLRMDHRSSRSQGVSCTARCSGYNQPIPLHTCNKGAVTVALEESEVRRDPTIDRDLVQNQDRLLPLQFVLGCITYDLALEPVSQCYAEGAFKYVS